jgi:hypothetical protein
MRLTIEEYRRRDYRTMCMQCGSWMRYSPTKKTPARRAASPHANMCLKCALLATRERNG